VQILARKSVPEPSTMSLTLASILLFGVLLIVKLRVDDYKSSARFRRFTVRSWTSPLSRYLAQDFAPENSISFRTLRFS